MKKPNRDEIETQLDDLAIGQLGVFAAWRLRRRIARNPELKLAWNEVRNLRTDLRQLSPSVSGKRFRRVGTFTVGGITMYRRTAALAAGSVMFFTVTGALAARYWPRPDVQAGLTTEGWAIDNWNFRGQFRGNITLYDVHGKRLNTTSLSGSSPDGIVHVSYERHDHELALTTIKGLGRHAIRDKTGKLCGIILLSPLSNKDEQQIAIDTNEILEDYLDLYRRPERVDPSDPKRGLSYENSLPGFVSGVFNQDYPHKKDIFLIISGGSWKVYGNVRVKATFYDKAHKDYCPGDKSWDAATGKILSDTSFYATLPAKLLVQNGVSGGGGGFSEDIMAQLTPAQQKEVASTFTPRTNPEAYWAIADPITGIDDKTGQWKHVLRSGTFSGYGHHVVEDDKGKPLMVLDISPLTPGKTAR